MLRIHFIVVQKGICVVDYIWLLSTSFPGDQMMSPSLCCCCLSPNIRKSSFLFRDLLPMLVGVHAYRCNHCFERQYHVVNPITRLVVFTSRKIDETVNLLHPTFRREHFARRRRRVAARRR